VGSDRRQLAKRVEKARKEMSAETIEAVADRGYHEGEEIRACEMAALPKPLTSSAKAEGRFGKQDFIYIAAEDVYHCPACERLTFRIGGKEDGKTIRRYWTTACRTCPLKAQCTSGQERRIPRWEHEAILRQDDGASFRHDQDLDGLDALSDAHASEGGHGNGA
jgi:hypothetical protein